MMRPAASSGRDPSGSPAIPVARGIAAIDDGAWARLSARRIFFGHQSVGYDIMAGVAEVVASDPRIQLRLRETREEGEMEAAGFYHARRTQSIPGREAA